jgi:hypothetical protein
LQLASVITQITSDLEKQTEVYKQQVQIVEALCKAKECNDNVNKNVEAMSNALKEAAGNAEKFGSKTQIANVLAGQLGESVKKVQEWAKKLSVPQQFLNGFKSGFSLSTNMLTSIMRLGGTALGLLKNIGGVLLSIPGRILDFFQGAAGGGTNEWAQALEEVRKEFGNLRIGTSANLVSMTKEMKGFTDAAGVGFSRVFGYGRAGLANLLKENLELAKGMGPLFDRMAESINKASPAFTIFRKATGLSAEAFKSLTIGAEAQGRTVQSAIDEMSVKIVQAERTFNISAKVIGRDLNEMMKDTATFGRMAPDVMIKTSAYVRKLGISIETLKKVMDKSLNFEDAAQQAASLAEAFNINIDAMKLMKEQDPTKKLDMIREGFFRTGRSVESLSIAEMKALQNTTGLSDEELRLSFSQKNRSVSQAQLAEQMKKGQKQQVTQAEAMKQLAESIERLVQSGSGMKGSFFDIFMKGFETGIRRTREFRRVVYNLQRSMRLVYFAGMEVGRMFVRLFPGIKDILGGLGDMFNPTRFRTLMSKVKDTFREFFTILQSDPKAGFERFMKRMKENFTDFFNAGSPAGSRFLNGLKKFFETVGVIFIQGLKYGLTAIGEALKGIIGFLKNPSSLSQIAGAAGSGVKGAFVQAFTYALTELRPVLSQIGELFKELFTELYTRYIQPHLRNILIGAFAFMFGPALVMGLVQAIFTGLIQAALPMIIARFSSVASRAGSVVNQASGAAAAAGGGAAGAGAAGEGGAVKVIQQAATQMKSLAGSLMTFVGAISTVVLAILLLAALASSLNIDPKMMFTMLGVFAGISLLFAFLIRIKFFESVRTFANRISQGNAATQIGKGLLAMGAIMIGISLIVMIAATLLSVVSPSSVELFLKVMGGMTLIMIGVGITAGILAALGAILTGPQVGFAAAGLVIAGVLLLAIMTLAVGTIPTFMSSMAGIDPTFAKSMMEVLSTFIGLVVDISKAVALLAFSGPFAAIGAIASFFTGGKSPLEQFESILTSVVNSAREVINLLNGMTGDPAVLVAKASVFSVISTGLAALIGPITTLLGDISDDFFASGSAAAAAKAATSIIEVIRILANPTDGVIPKILEQIKTIAISDVDPNKMKAAAEVFSALSTGIGEVIKSIGEMLQSLDSGFAINPFMLIGSALSLGAKLEAIQKVSQVILPAIGTLLKEVTREVADLSRQITNVEALKAMGPILSSIAQVVGSVLSNITALVKGNSGGGQSTISFNFSVSTEDAEDLRRKLTEVGIFISSVSLSLKNLLRDIFGSLTPLINAAPTDPSKIKGLGVVSEIIKSASSMIAPIIQSIGTLIQNVKADKDITADKIREVGTQVTQIVGSVVTNMAGMFDNIPTLVARLSLIAVPAGLGGKVKALAGIFDLIKSVSSIVSSFTVTAAGGTTRQMNVITEIFSPVMDLLSALFADPVNSTRLVNVINALASRQFANVRAAGERAKGIKNLFEGIKAVAEAVKSLTELSTTTTITTGLLDQTMINIAVILGAITKTEYAGNRNPFLNPGLFSNLSAIRSGLKGRLSLINDLKDKLTTFVGAVNGMGTAGIGTVGANIAEQVQQKVEQLYATIERMNTYFGAQGVEGRRVAIDSMLANITTNLSGPLLRNVRGMVAAYNQFASEFAQTSDLGSINSSVQRVGSRLGSLRELEIKRGTMNMQLTIKVQIDAGDITKALYSWNTQNNNNARGGEFSATAFNPMTQGEGPA